MMFANDIRGLQGYQVEAKKYSMTEFLDTWKKSLEEKEG